MQSGTNLVIFNQIFPTGSSVISGLPYDGALPLVFNGSGNQTSGVLSGNNFYQLSYEFNTNFSSIIYLNYSGCNYSGNNNLLLASTTTNPSGNPNSVYLGITPSNRIFVNAPNYSSTIPREIGVSDFVYLGVNNNQFVNYGLFSIADNYFYGGTYDAGSPILNIQDLSFGGALNYPANFTGYSGVIKEIYLFSGGLQSNSINNCINCAFATGTTITTTPYTFTGIQITGSIWSGVQTTAITGEALALVPYLTQTGTGYVYANSGLSGVVTNYQSLVPLIENIPYTVTGSGETILFNNAAKISGLLYDIYFTQGLTSGDIVETYSYSTPNYQIGLPISNFQFPSSNQIVQLYGNGLAESQNIDYYVAFNNLIVGFDSQDILQYDIVSAAYTVPYATGYIMTGVTGSNFVQITGVSGLNISGFPFAFYLNGQKMPSGVNYSVSGIGIVVSGNDLSDINDASGDLLEAKFIPIYPNTTDTVYTITQSGNYISGVALYDLSVWWNGLRLYEGIDYFVNPRCEFCKNNFISPNYGFGLYNSMLDDIGLFN